MGDRAGLTRALSRGLARSVRDARVVGAALVVSGCAATATPPALAPNAPATSVQIQAGTPSSSAWPLAQALRIPSRDGTLITAWWLPAGGASDTAAAISPVRPVVILLHGCGGLYSVLRDRPGQLTQRHGGFADRLRAEGWHVLLPDSLTARGERSLCEQPFAQRRVHQTHRRDDVLGTLSWLAQQPWADASRMALVGWSHGGSAVLAATDLTDPAVRAQALRPRAAVAFYPGCSEVLRRGYRPATPLTLLLGEKDDWTPAEPCVRLAAAAGAQAKVYPDSHHGFDSPTGRVQHLPNVPNGVNPGRGVHAGRNPITGPQAWDDAIGLLREALRGG